MPKTSKSAMAVSHATRTAAHSHVITVRIGDLSQSATYRQSPLQSLDGLCSLPQHSLMNINNRMLWLPGLRVHVSKL